MSILKEARLNKGYTMLQVANYAGCSESVYCLYEKQKRRPRDIDVAKKIGELLGVSWTVMYDVRRPANG